MSSGRSAAEVCALHKNLPQIRFSKRKKSDTPPLGPALFPSDLSPALEYVGYMLTRTEFVTWLAERRAAGHSFTTIGRDLGVSRQAVQQWLSGATQPSRMALVLAEQLCHMPLELPPGLPVAAERERPS
jgi:hypothetical protein